ncbi:MAG: hypothetical protein B7Z07_00245 [Sphingomonadales bacterium 32-67-7]|nr:MAG: hypothetical protein B7Z07_00245 [Sphingomonadales bacterium 32-67-7]
MRSSRRDDIERISAPLGERGVGFRTIGEVGTETQRFDREEDQPVQWVAPLQSIETFSISEFTLLHSLPGDDSLGTFTQS